MKKKFIYGMMFFLILQGTGCGSLPKKFIRQKPTPAHTAAVVYMEKGPYQKKFSNEYYYKMHYTLWKTWQGEILDNLGGNAKKLQRSAEEAYSHLDQMGRYLDPEKKAQLQALSDELKRFVDKFENSNYSRSEEASMKSDLERIQRLVSNDFYYDKVKPDILPDNVDLGTAPPAA